MTKKKPRREEKGKRKLKMDHKSQFDNLYKNIKRAKENFVECPEWSPKEECSGNGWLHNCGTCKNGKWKKYDAKTNKAAEYECEIGKEYKKYNKII